jgi:hypothetical protein
LKNFSELKKSTSSLYNQQLASMISYELELIKKVKEQRKKEKEEKFEF